MNVLDLTPFEFDQTDKGWRALDARGEYLQAAELIVRFIEEHWEDVTSNPSIQTLCFHAGQEYAMAGEDHYDKAIHYFCHAFKDKIGEQPGSWDLYVTGSVAYLKKDLGVLEAAKTELSNNGDSNTVILERFANALKRGDLSYAKNYEVST